MADQNKPSAPFQMTAPCTLLYPKELFTPKPKFAGKGDLVYGGTFVLAADHPDLANIKATMAKVAALGGASDWRSPLKSGTKIADKDLAKDKDKYNKYKESNDFKRGKALLTPTSKQQPELGVMENGQMVILRDPALIGKFRDRFYQGANVLCLFSFQYYPQIIEDDGAVRSRAGVACYVNGVLSTGGGKRIGSSRVSMEQAFSGYVGTVSAEDPTGGASADDDAF